MPFHDSTNIDSGFIYSEYRMFFPVVFSKAYESICQVIKDYTISAPTTTTTRTRTRTINYYEAVRIAYGLSKELRVYLDIENNDIWENRIDKNLKRLWPFTYKIVNLDKRINVINRNPDNLLVSWQPGAINEEPLFPVSSI